MALLQKRPHFQVLLRKWFNVARKNHGLIVFFFACTWIHHQPQTINSVTTKPLLLPFRAVSFFIPIPHGRKIDEALYVEKKENSTEQKPHDNEVWNLKHEQSIWMTGTFNYQLLSGPLLEYYVEGLFTKKEEDGQGLVVVGRQFPYFLKQNTTVMGDGMRWWRAVGLLRV